MKYLYIIEKGKNNFSAYMPDLPGCISKGKSRKEIAKNIQEAIEFHIEGMVLDGEKIPDPTDNFGFIKVKPPVKNPEKRKLVRKRKVMA